MNIRPLNNTNNSFNGKIITRGAWTKKLEKTFRENPEIQQLASGKMNVVGEMSHRKILSFIDKIHPIGMDTYKLKIYAENEKPSLFETLKSLLGLNKSKTLSHFYHSEKSTLNIINQRIKAPLYKHLFNL